MRSRGSSASRPAIYRSAATGLALGAWIRRRPSRKLTSTLVARQSAREVPAVVGMTHAAARDGWR